MKQIEFIRSQLSDVVKITDGENSIELYETDLRRWVEMRLREDRIALLGSRFLEEKERINKMSLSLL